VGVRKLLRKTFHQNIEDQNLRLLYKRKPLTEYYRRQGFADGHYRHCKVSVPSRISGGLQTIRPKLLQPACFGPVAAIAVPMAAIKYAS
jgi:hypothetical protein